MSQHPEVSSHEDPPGSFDAYLDQARFLSSQYIDRFDTLGERTTQILATDAVILAILAGLLTWQNLSRVGVVVVCVAGTLLLASAVVCTLGVAPTKWPVASPSSLRDHYLEQRAKFELGQPLPHEVVTELLAGMLIGGPEEKSVLDSAARVADRRARFLQSAIWLLLGGLGTVCLGAVLVVGAAR